MGDHVCPWWLAYTFDNPLRALFHKPEIMFADHVQEGMTVADIGCGMGYFSIGLARIVKETGRVIAVDLQAKMLEKMEQRAKKKGVGKVIHPIQCSERDIGISEPLDFALAFWMVHETPDVERFFEQIHQALKPKGLVYITEPRFHVTEAEYRRELEIAFRAGFEFKEEPLVKFSHAAILGKVD